MNSAAERSATRPTAAESDAAKKGTEKPGTAAASGRERQQQQGKQVAEQTKSADARAVEKQSPQSGKDTGNDGANPKPQNAVVKKKPGQADDAPGQRKGEMAKSPSADTRASDSKGETSGDRSGGGEQGGGQHANKSGIGSGGSHTAADEGAGKSDEQGKGEVGQKAGDQAATKQPTDSAAKQRADDGSGTRQQQSADNAAGGKGADSNDTAEGGTPSKDQSKAGMSGNVRPDAKGNAPTAQVGGGKPGNTSDTVPPPEAADAEADSANLEYARRQSALALEHLRDQLAKEKPDLLDRLGWSKEDARRFLDRWEAMQQSAAENGAAGTAAKRSTMKPCAASDCADEAPSCGAA